MSSQLEEENRHLRLELAAAKAALAKYESKANSSVGEVSDVEEKEAEPISNMSASAAALALASNVSFEYVADSPFFRRSAVAFEEAADGLDILLKEFSQGTKKWTIAQAEADAEARRVSEWLRDRRHGRALFSGASGYESLGEISEILNHFADLIDVGLIAQRESLASAMHQVAEAAHRFRVEDIGDVRGYREKVWRMAEDYETGLCEALRASKNTTKITLQTQELREKFEIARFGLVQHLNLLDARKKLALAQIMGVDAPKAIYTYFTNGNQAILSTLGGIDTIHILEKKVERGYTLLRRDEALWSKIMDRLEAELRGELPPPGAPNGARTVAPPRSLQVTPTNIISTTTKPAATAAPPWSAALTTEVLSASSLKASRTDLAHARDEGVLKQGYLHRRDFDSTSISGLVRGLTSQARQRRRWHRLHNSALYLVSDDGDETKLCDLAGCAVHRGAGAWRPGLDPDTSVVGATIFSFALVRPDGHRMLFQADNQDELIKWISALRRSTTRTNFQQSEDTLTDNANLDKIRAFVKANCICAECGASRVEWVATAIGCALCVDCATIHRKLGASCSNLRALFMDSWSALMLDYLLRAAGNKKVNAVWEHSVPRGWHKPTSDAPLHEKEMWIVAKYVWFGFIGDSSDNSQQDPTSSELSTNQQDLARRKQKLASASSVHTASTGTSTKSRDSIAAANIDLATSAFYNDVTGLMRAHARRASATWQDPNNRSRSALHVAALAGNVDAVAFLILNGGDSHQQDADGATPLSLASSATDGKAAVAVAQLILESEQGELW